MSSIIKVLDILVVALAVWRYVQTKDVLIKWLSIGLAVDWLNRSSVTTYLANLAWLTSLSLEGWLFVDNALAIALAILVPLMMVYGAIRHLSMLSTKDLLKTIGLGLAVGVIISGLLFLALQQRGGTGNLGDVVSFGDLVPRAKFATLNVQLDAPCLQ